MDLGATVCTRSSAKCDICPMQTDCLAFQANRVAELPTRKPKKTLPVREKRFLIIRNELGHYLLEKRPPSGIWGGLWSLPELAMEELIDEAVQQNWQLTVNDYNDLPVFRHTFSHFHLDITPCQVSVAAAGRSIAESQQYQWCSEINELALAAPVSLILQS